MLSNMASSLIMHKRIFTTLAKAKALRGYVEPLITKAKEDTTHSRRTVFKYLKNKYAVTELFREISVKVGDRPGGYTRIIKLENRLGDNAEMAMIELVDYNENLLKEKTAKKAKSRRRRGGKKSTAAEQTTEAATTATAATATEEKEEVKAEAVEEKVEEKNEEVVEETPKAEEKSEEPEAKAEKPLNDEEKKGEK
jgi:large subunit ribosomal protein L17